MILRKFTIKTKITKILLRKIKNILDIAKYIEYNGYIDD